MQGSPFAHRRVVVLGLGVHGGGAAVARWLARQGAQVTVTDLKTRVELAPSLKTLKGLPIRYVLGTHPMRLLSRCDLVVQNPAVPANHPFLKAAARLGVAVENEASLFLKLCPSQRVVAVTGTRGKSTTVSLLGAMLRHTWPRTVVAGNIRDTVLFDALDRLTPRTPLALELSSWQLELVGKHQLRIPLAVVTNVLPDHLNRYPSFAAYARAKSFIFTYQDKQDALVLNYDNPITRGFAQRARGRVYWVSLRRAVPRGCFVRGVVVHWRDGAVNERLFSVSDLVLTGEHNLYNALSAAAAARLMGVTPSSICQAIRSFQGLHDRLELVRTMGGVRFVNDTTATS
ncbi:MAG: UDP-N-acetylmuramoyl-L-alanine--D-glutamate ligase, partial [Candidatus Veblenbacteria bacterium]|nr:UDP-N-acetylmuramoyl-L-alanine--D-glutamate ligase [Candidatus Veblenbacteria bacterium]